MQPTQGCPAGGSQANAAGPHAVLDALFMYEPQQKLDMLQTVQQGRMWKKILLVPASVKQELKSRSHLLLQSQHSAITVGAARQDSKALAKDWSATDLSRAQSNLAEDGWRSGTASMKNISGPVQTKELSEIELLLPSNSFCVPSSGMTSDRSFHLDLSESDCLLHVHIYSLAKKAAWQYAVIAMYGVQQRSRIIL